VQETTYFDFSRFLTVLRRRQWILYSSVAAILIFTIIFVMLTPKVYQATTKILITPRKYSLGVERMWTEDEKTIANEIEMLTSSSFIHRVFERLKKENPDLPILKKPSPVYELMKNYSVMPVGKSNVIRITFHSNYPEEAAIVANAIANTAVEFSLEFEKNEITQVKRFLEEQIPKAEERLKKAEIALEEYKKKSGIISISEHVKSITNEMTNFNDIYNRALVEYSSKQVELNALKTKLDNIKENLSSQIVEVTGRYINDLRDKLVSLERDLTLYEIEGLPQNHPKIVEIKKDIEDLKKKLKDEISNFTADTLGLSDPISITGNLIDRIMETEIDLLVLKTRKEVLESMREKYLKKIKALPEKETRLAELQREYDMASDIYKLLTEKYEEFKIEEARKVGNVRVIEYAETPSFPVKPKKKLSFALAFIGGIILGIIGITLVELIDTTVKDEADIEEITDIPVIGIIPHLENHKKGNGVLSITEKLIVHYKPQSSISEAYKTLRANLDFIGTPDKGEGHTYLITSAIPQEGKSTISANLAISTAQTDNKTLIIDADLRYPMIHRIFEMEHTEGLSEYLIGKLSIEKVIRDCDIKNLWILPSGTVPPNPAELLAKDKFKKLINTLMKRFDYIFIDSPPVIFSDTRYLVSHIKNVLLVTRAGLAKKEIVIKALNTLENIGSPPEGIVLNDVEYRGTHYHYYYPYYGYSKREEKQ